MEKQNDNRDQIIRKDARNCFVEVKNDCFHLEKIHLQFVAYDKSRPAGQRYTSNILIYIDVPQFLALAQEAEAQAQSELRRAEERARERLIQAAEWMAETAVIPPVCR